MSAQLFVKFQYKEQIKKLRISQENLKWETFLDVLSRSFDLSRDNIRLTYKDSEGDEITVNGDQDLVEAFSLAANDRTIRFVIYEINRPLKNEKKKTEEKEKRKLRSPKLRKEKSENLTLENVNTSKKILKESSNNSQIEEPAQKRQRKLCPTSQEMENVLNKIFFSKEAQREIQQLVNHPSLKENLDHDSSSNIRVEIDQSFLAEYFERTFNDILNRPQEETIQESVVEKTTEQLTTSIKKSFTTEEEKVETKRFSSRTSLDEDLLDMSLKETIYEKTMTNLEVTRTKASLLETSTSVCKDLTSTLGVKLTLKLENGKMKLMSIPISEYSIIDSVAVSSTEKV